MIELDTVYLRASVASKCNLNCVYCPKKSGMEDRTPDSLRSRTLSLTDYIDCLRAVAMAGVRRVSFTGGEPTTNSHLPEIVRAAAEVFDVVELTTNGFRLAQMLPQMADHLDLIKISLDSMDRGSFSRLARGPTETLDIAVAAVRSSILNGIRVGINFVLLRSNEHHLEGVIDFVRLLNMEFGTSVYVSVLDFYYSDEQRKVWETDYMPISSIEAGLLDRYGNMREEVRFGCRFSWVICDGVEVRMKESAGATMRAEICRGCAHYCQEGLYGLKLSTSGWVTTCPSNEARFGSDLHESIRMSTGQMVLANQIERLAQAVPDQDSFGRLLRTHGLSLTTFTD